MTFQEQLRARARGRVVGSFPTGPANAITDVGGVRVGHTTLLDSSRDIYTGVTAITHPALIDCDARCAGLFVANGYGKFIGATQVLELGQIETPILLTSTLSAFRSADALLTWLFRRQSVPPTSLNPIVGEVNDSWLSQGDPRPITAETVWSALDSARSGTVQMGNVGGGTGACALGFKAGIGTASRRVVLGSETATLGVLVQANMSGTLRMGGETVRPSDFGLVPAGPSTADGSCVVVATTDYPCASGDLTRLARRSVYALGRVGAAYSHGSGDYGLAFSTHPPERARILPPVQLDVLFSAVMDAVEEAVLDALLLAGPITTTTGRIASALPHDIEGLNETTRPEIRGDE